MRFSIYSEIQQHTQTPEQLYAEVLEQIVNADRLGYHTYAAIEHFFFPKFSISANPTALFAAAAQKTRNITFRTLLHALPFHNPLVLASTIAATDILTGGRYEFGVGRGHGWIPSKAGLALDEESRPRYEEAVTLLFKALTDKRFSHHGTYFHVDDSHIAPFPARKLRIYLGGTSDRTYELAAQHGWGVAVPPLIPYAALAKQLEFYRAKCTEFGTTPDIVWIRACHLDHDRDTAMREARRWIPGFIQGNSSPLTEYDKPPAADLLRAGYGAYATGVLESLAAIPFDQLVAEQYVWAGTPADILEQIAATRAQCPGIMEICITVNGGGAPHWMAIKNQELFAHDVMPHVPA
ncbi:MAG TPA: LLM class flavin-dependent oxidoreductase [Kofleriaceae bacterium]|jgi:alkanesulfonate monooxygenase SsuD/methylene tetrahydromethanopterin reductase-like flavin-dependent oxidoreductase (luciferase family)|nr:LLM class flavin-dependent oxidoreductase [Kofleriaceae bacterium]